MWQLVAEIPAPGLTFTCPKDGEQYRELDYYSKLVSNK